MKVTGKMVKCPKCGKEMIDKGLGGHLFGVHMIRVGEKAELATLRDVKPKYEERIKELESRLGNVRDMWNGSNGKPGENVSALISEALNSK